MKGFRLSRNKHFLRVGFEPGSNNTVDIALSALFSPHCHILGPPGMGKTRLLFWIFQQLARLREVTIILLNVKGDLGLMCRDWSIAHGLTRRLDWFCPGQEPIIGYDPVRPNHLPVATHAKLVREAVRSAWGQTNFDATAQLARWLYVVLFVTREREFTLAESLALLRPDSIERRALLPQIRDTYIRAEFMYLDSLRETRQDEILASTLARLQSFILDPTIRRILTQQARSLDLGEVINQHKILLLNFEQYRPLSLDDIKLLGRFILNDVLVHAFNRPTGQRSAVYLLIDECQNFVTTDLCRALDQGRELGLFCLLSHQHLAQLKEEQ